MKLKSFIHHIKYLPTGELFAEQRDYWHTPYRFNGKELDEETGYYYYGARYYTPEVGIWLSVDPLSDKYPSLSPFMYCAGNPVIYIDPDGRDIYQVDESGNFKGRLERSYDQFQVVSVDGKTVLSSSEKYKKNTVINSVSGIPTVDPDGKPITIDAYAIKGSKNGESIHQFLSDNTDVEYARWDFSSGLNVIGTSHDTGREVSAGFMKKYLSNNNWFGFLRTFDHNHPDGSNVPSGTWRNKKDESGDTDFVKSIEAANPNVISRIYTKENGYSYYNGYGPCSPPVIIKSN